MTFADGYRQLVIPRLERIIKLEANHVAHDIQNFMGAWCSVMHYANKWGSGALPSDVFTDLEDWVSATLLLEIQAAERLSGYP